MKNINIAISINITSKSGYDATTVLSVGRTSGGELDLVAIEKDVKAKLREAREEFQGKIGEMIEKEAEELDNKE